MHTLLIVMTIAMAVGMGWSIGANDAANSLGTAVGAKVITLRQAIVLIAVFGFLGAVLQGEYVAKTLGKGIVDMTVLPADVATRVALVATLASGLWVALATRWRMPVSTSHAIVGAVGGCGLALHADLNWRVLGGIFVCWVLTPAGAAFIGWGLFRLLEAVLPRIVPARYMRQTLTALIVISGCYVAFSWGANDVANATGVLQGANVLPGKWAVTIGGAAIVLGIVTYGHRVMEMVGCGIAQLTPLMAFAVQLASAVNVHAYTLLGIPVSTSHSIVGAIFGVGLVKGVRVVNLRIMREIVTCWVATPFVSGVFSLCILRLWMWLSPVN